MLRQNYMTSFADFDIAVSQYFFVYCNVLFILFSFQTFNTVLLALLLAVYNIFTVQVVIYFLFSLQNVLYDYIK